MKKKVIYLLLIAVLSSILFFLITKKLDNDKPNVTVVLKDLDSEYWELMEAGAENGFKDFGINGKVIAPVDGVSIEGQTRFLEQVLKEKPDCLIIAPIYTEAVASSLEKFAEQDIPVILIDTNVSWEDKTTYVGTDNVYLGKRAGELLGSQLQPGNDVALLGVDQSSPVASDRIKGAKKSLQSVGINIVAEAVDVNSKPEQVKKELEKILEKHPNLKGIIATNDGLAISVYDGLKELGYQMPVLGADGTKKMIELIEEEKLPGTVAQNPYDMGYLSIETVRKALNGEHIESSIDTGVDIIIKGNGEHRIEFQERVLGYNE